MKRYLFFLVCCFIFDIQQTYAQMSGNGNDGNGSNNPMEIKLIENDVPEKGRDPVTRSLPLKFVQAYLYNRVVSIQFNADPTSVTVEITRLQTGVKVYSKTIHQDDLFTFDLTGWQSGEYKLCIKTDEKIFEGKFAL